MLRKRLPSLVARLARIDRLHDIALTTNGSLLATQARALREAGLHRITVSLDALDPGVFRTLSGGRGDIADVLAGIQAAGVAGFAPVKLNCVVQRGINDDQVLPWSSTRVHAATCCASSNTWTWAPAMAGGANAYFPRSNCATASTPAGRCARWIRIPWRGRCTLRLRRRRRRTGFVSSVSTPFCGDCQRARISADGTLYTCLVAGGGRALRHMLAQGERALADEVAALWSRRGDRYSELRATAAPSRRKVEMFLIGG